MASHYNTSEAYDFDLFQPKKKLEEPRETNNVIEIPKEKLDANRHPGRRAARVISTFASLLVMMGIVGSVVYGQVRLSELTEKLDTATSQLSESESQYTQLKMKYDAQLSLDTVEKYAEVNLGMRKLERNQVEYISLADGDKGEVLEESSRGLLDQICAVLRGLVS